MIAYLSHVWNLRFFWLALVRNDLQRRYQGSWFGMGWSLLQPIAMTAVLSTVFCNVFLMSLRDYAPFLLVGLTFWNFLASVMNQGCFSFLQGESYIRQHRAPLAIYPLRTTLGAGYHFLIGLVVVTLFVWGVRGFDNVSALWSILPTLVLLFVFGWSLTVCAGTLNVLFHDTQHLLDILLQILFYMTPIIYPASVLNQRNLGWAVNINPIAVMIELVRPPLLEGRLPTPETIGMSLVVTLVTFVVACLMLTWCERRLVFYL
ncbi:MAG: ABC transporter permease [Thermoguttaceae bacterium]|jgi:lipopolysaccharide transport system permease protein